MTPSKINELEDAEFQPSEVSEWEEAGTESRIKSRNGINVQRPVSEATKARYPHGAFQLLFQVIEPGHPLEGQPLVCFCNAPKGFNRNAGQMTWSAQSKYAKAWIMANGGRFPSRWDRLTPRYSKARPFEAELVPSQNPHFAELRRDATRSGEYKGHGSSLAIPRTLPGQR